MAVTDWLGRIFGQKARVAVATLQRLGKPVWMQQNLEAFATEGYATNVVVFRCVDVVSKALASIPLDVFQNGELAGPEHPLVKLLKRPNPRMTRSRMVQTLASFKMIAGNAWMEKIGAGGLEEETSAANPPRELWIWLPYKMTPVVPKMNGRGSPIPVGYQWDDGTRQIGWEVDRLTGRSCMLHWFTFNALNPWVGMSPIQPMARSVDQRNSADEWNQALLQNSASPSGVLTSPTEITDPQYKQLREQMDGKYGGPWNSGRPLLLSGGITWEQMGLSPREMEWLEGKNVASRDICSAFGVPTQLAGIQGDQTFANFAEARLALWEDTVIPMGFDLVEQLNHWFAEDFPGAEIVMDLDKIPALAARRAAKWEMANKSTFISTNERRKMVDLAPIEESQGNGDQILVNGSMVTLEEVTSDLGELIPRNGQASLDFPRLPQTPEEWEHPQAKEVREFAAKLKNKEAREWHEKMAALLEVKEAMANANGNGRH